MGDFLSYDKMSEEERCALSVLSWVPLIEAESLLEILKKCSVSDAGEVLKRMVLKHLANWDGEFFSIAGPIRFAFRQLHGFGDAKVLESISSYFSDKFEESDNLDNEFVDRALFVISMERGLVPDNFKNILSVNTVLKTASSLYRRGRYEKDKVDLNRALDLCNLALTLKTERHIHRELLGVKIRCLLKLNRLTEADTEIGVLEKSVDRDTAILRAQYYRASNDIQLANSSFKLAISAGNNSDSVLHEYCTCLKKVANYKEIYRIIDTYSRRVQKNAFLLDLKISLEIGRGDFPEAEETIKTLRSHPEDNYKSFRREAILIHRRDKNLPKAEAIIDLAISRAESEGGRVPLDLYITRCIIRAHLHKEKETTEDFAIIRNRCIDPTTIEHGLSLYILACKHQYSDVFRQIDTNVNYKKSNVIIMRDILQIMEADDGVPGFEKAEANSRLRDLLPFSDKITAFDIIGD